MMSGVRRIADERHRQIEHEGWTAVHDDEYVNGELAQAAVCYANYAGVQRSASVGASGDRIPHGWPWEGQWWKLSGDRIRDLVKAGALIAAEIDRLDRQR